MLIAGGLGHALPIACDGVKCQSFILGRAFAGCSRRGAPDLDPVSGGVALDGAVEEHAQPGREMQSCAVSVMTSRTTVPGWERAVPPADRIPRRVGSTGRARTSPPTELGDRSTRGRLAGTEPIVRLGPSPGAVVHDRALVSIIGGALRRPRARCRRHAYHACCDDDLRPRADGALASQRVGSLKCLAGRI